MRNRRNHLGTGFDVWDDQEAWFWLVVSPRRDGGIIGSVATEADAVREARASIEELSSSRRADLAALRVTRAGAAVPRSDQFDAIIFAGWRRSLTNLERYLAFRDGASV
jgi:hypothetical protein